MSRQFYLPNRIGLGARLRAAGVRTAPIEELCAAALKLGQAGTGARSDGPIVAVCEYRDGSVIDLLRVVH